MERECCYRTVWIGSTDCVGAVCYPLLYATYAPTALFVGYGTIFCTVCHIGPTSVLVFTLVSLPVSTPCTRTHQVMCTGYQRTKACYGIHTLVPTNMLPPGTFRMRTDHETERYGVLCLLVAPTHLLKDSNVT